VSSAATIVGSNHCCFTASRAASNGDVNTPKASSSDMDYLIFRYGYLVASSPCALTSLGKGLLFGKAHSRTFMEAIYSTLHALYIRLLTSAGQQKMYVPMRAIGCNKFSLVEPLQHDGPVGLRP
jgi:hypothetical protein